MRGKRGRRGGFREEGKIGERERERGKRRGRKGGKKIEREVRNASVSDIIRK